MRTALLAGATGLVGGHLLELLLADDTWDRVVSVGRREVDRRDPKLEQLVVLLPEIGELPPVDDVFCALGTTIKKAGSQEAFRAIDHDAVVALAAAARQAGATSFLHVTSWVRRRLAGVLQPGQGRDRAGRRRGRHPHDGRLPALDHRRATATESRTGEQLGWSRCARSRRCSAGSGPHAPRTSPGDGAPRHGWSPGAQIASRARSRAGLPERSSEARRGRFGRLLPAADIVPSRSGPVLRTPRTVTTQSRTQSSKACEASPTWRTSSPRSSATGRTTLRTSATRP